MIKIEATQELWAGLASLFRLCITMIPNELVLIYDLMSALDYIRIIKSTDSTYNDELCLVSITDLFHCV